MTTMTTGPRSAALDRARLDSCVERAGAAAYAFRQLDQEAVDRIVRAVVIAGLEHAVELAELAIEETGFGVFEDKVIKNLIATETLYDYLDGKRTVGVIFEDPERALVQIAEPIGVVLALLPITNPTSTALSKAIIAAKTRNAVIFRPAARAARCAQRAIEIMQAAGRAVGLPPDAFQVVADPTRDASQYLFHHGGVDMIWTTGGPQAVQAASRAGKPCIGVGSGNVPVYLHRSADLRAAVVDILISKTFDASVVCSAEQTLVIDEAIYEAVVAEFERMGARTLCEDECHALATRVLGADGHGRAAAMGRSCAELAAMAGFAWDCDDETKVLLAPLPADLAALADHPLLGQKPMPVLGIVCSPSVEHAIAACELVTEQGGLGHSSSVHARDEDVIARFADAMRTGRIVVNTPSAVGACGGVYNALAPTLSMACGTWGGANTTANVNYRELLNVKTVARPLAPPQHVRTPGATTIDTGAIKSLRELAAAQVLIVTDAETQARGAVDEVRGHLSMAVHVFSDLGPEPTDDRVRAGTQALVKSGADLVVAVGGGSVIDAAKAMRLFCEHPDLDLHELALPFLDPRKRVARYPTTEHHIGLVAVPTTSGSGSEVSHAAVLMVGGAKVTLMDGSLMPDVALVDPRLMLSMPPVLTADTGIDALTHALEAYVSVFASPRTDAFCMRAIRLVLEALPRAVADGGDLAARTDMANAATIAGLAFSNAFAGVNHGLAHALGARFGVAHGRANGLFLPHVLRYNAQIPTKVTAAPGYGAYVAPEKYARLAWALGFGARSESAACERLFTRIEQLLETVGMPRTIADLGLHPAGYAQARDDLAMAAFRDPSLRTNPRMPLVAELRELLHAVT
jgi:acetaldehyde dehydrogenase/alcohol dehydrogenase